MIGGPYLSAGGRGEAVASSLEYAFTTEKAGLAETPTSCGPIGGGGGWAGVGLGLGNKKEKRCLDRMKERNREYGIRFLVADFEFESKDSNQGDLVKRI
jgi:hypothetical protein